MLVVTDHCTIKTLLITSPTKDKIVKFEIDTDKYPNQKILLGKKIGDIFQKSDLSSSLYPLKENLYLKLS